LVAAALIAFLAVLVMMFRKVAAGLTDYLAMAALMF
jgi:hypothetical protein